MSSDIDPRTEGPVRGDERAMLVGFLRWQRETLEMKCAGLDASRHNGHADLLHGSTESWVSSRRTYYPAMCRNITELRGLEPPATREEIDAAARQYVRKVTGVSRPNLTLVARMETAALEIAEITEQLLHELPARRQPPKTVPPLRRPDVRERLGLAPFSA